MHFSHHVVHLCGLWDGRSAGRCRVVKLMSVDAAARYKLTIEAAEKLLQ